MKYATARPYADPEKGGAPDRRDRQRRRAGSGRIHIEKVNGPFLFRDGGSPAENGGGMKLAVDAAG
jgi:hypothetical protein